MPFLLPNQQHQSKHWRQFKLSSWWTTITRHTLSICQLLKLSSRIKYRIRVVEYGIFRNSIWVADIHWNWVSQNHELLNLSTVFNFSRATRFQHYRIQATQIITCQRFRMSSRIQNRTGQQTWDFTFPSKATLFDYWVLIRYSIWALIL